MPAERVGAFMLVCHRPSDPSPLKLLPSMLARHAISETRLELFWVATQKNFKCIRLLFERAGVFILVCRRPSDPLETPALYVGTSHN
jgi:hypothetical protein